MNMNAKNVCNELPAKARAALLKNCSTHVDTGTSHVALWYILI